MRLLSTIAALTVAACLAVVPVSAAVAAPETAPGADVSWPQCSKALIPPQAFGIVGVNGQNNASGNTTNGCLTAELNWAGGVVRLGRAAQDVALRHGARPWHGRVLVAELE